MSGRNPSELEGADDHAKLQDLCTRTYKEQTVWFMNAYWESIVKDQAQRFWDYKHKMDELDLQDHEMGCGLDEMKAHVFLEHFKETQTVREMRTNLRASGAVGEKERPKNVPMTHFLLFRYKVDWHELVNAPQGDNSEEIRKAQQMLEAAQAACKEAERTATAAAAALRESIAAEADARQRDEQAKADAAEAAKREAQAKADAEAAAQREAKAHADAEAAKAREAEAEAAQNELEAALAELKAQEDAYNNKTKELEQKSETGGVVSRNKAKNELAQHLGEDPLPLRRAKITQEAAVKKADRARQAAADAREAAEASAAAATEARQAADASAQAASQARAAADESARQAAAARAEAEAARARSEQAKAAADAALQDARDKMAAAEAYLEEQKNKPGSGKGALAWMSMELEEAKRYMPESKGGIRRR